MFANQKVSNTKFNAILSLNDQTIKLQRNRQVDYYNTIIMWIFTA